MHEGGVDCTIERLNDSKLRENARKDIINGLPGWENVSHQAGWENLVVLSNKIGDMRTSSMQAIADHQQLDPPSVVFSILLKDPYCNLIAHWVDEEDVISFMQHDCQMWGSDSAEPGPLAHPRTYGAYPKILREYVFEKHVLSLERAIHKMTLLPAKRFGLKNRGMIKKGWAADLTIFDPQTIAARSTFEHPDQYPEGIKYVIVNGKLAVKGGKTNLANYGIVLS
jgi:N-acyl-D-aspartate/D-glutamate deacylase